VAAEVLPGQFQAERPDNVGQAGEVLRLDRAPQGIWLS
jgi:hypothetical protein